MPNNTLLVINCETLHLTGERVLLSTKQDQQAAQQQQQQPVFSAEVKCTGEYAPFASINAATSSSSTVAPSTPVKPGLEVKGKSNRLLLLVPQPSLLFLLCPRGEACRQDSKEGK